ncbi:hypothetical protein IWW37_001186 [Coemansia sp. RSA 2050]|nr:hypothetical protein IWW37_001186 [Coemansia sp. RSA 2050]KAJ2733792.1 hypothetical protein IW152_002784 [Coemansia sp. BCRC 34962]
MTLPYIIARRPLHFSRALTLPLMAVNASLGVLVFVQGCLSLSAGDVRHIMLGIACLVAGVLVLSMEFVHLAAVRMYASFLFSFTGRGLFYLVCGILTIDSTKAELGIGLVLVIFSLFFIGLALVSTAYYDDPQDEYAAMIYNIQHGHYSNMQKPDPHNMSTSKKSRRAGNAFAGQGISSSDTFNMSGASYLPQSAIDFSSSMATSGLSASDKAPRI